jgi:phosphate transport system substrate-binding protein
MLLLPVAMGMAVAAETLNGAGATFPYPIYSKWFSEYHKVRPDVQINYQSIGSGGGIRQVIAGTVDFGASDTPLSDDQLRKVGAKLLHIPTVLGAVVPAYNLKSVSADLKFTPEALVGIFLGRITKWNDKAIRDANPGVQLPDRHILIVHRSDGSGTTFVWTDYLSKVSPEWKRGPGAGTSVRFPVGLGAKGNEGVAGLVRQMDGAIGYIELNYAMQNNIRFGAVRNAQGEFVKAGLESTTAAAASVTKMPDDFRVSITNPPGKGAYPIASFTWLLVKVPGRDPRKNAILAEFLDWMLREGQKSASHLNYAPLPPSVVQKVRLQLKEIR